jgi:hypothetical protein
MTRPSTEEEGSSPLSTPNRPPAIAGGAVATAGQQYIVRSLELTTQAFQDLLTLTSKQTISRLARSTCCQRPKSRSRLSGAFQSNPPRRAGTCPRNLCISYGRIRRVETNLSNLPQPFTMCQSNRGQNPLSTLIRCTFSACHSERSEESLLCPECVGSVAIPHFVRNDRTKAK